MWTVAAALVARAPQLLATEGAVGGGEVRLDPRLGVWYRVLPGRPMSAALCGDVRCPCYAVTATGIVHCDPVRGRRVCFPAIVDEGLMGRILAAVRSAARDILARQAAAGWEIAGLITADERRLSDVRVLACNQNAGGAYTSEPYCGGRRRCRETEVTRGRVVLGEFHSHPDHGRPHLDFFPPSGSDLYQLALAAQSGTHNLSIVVAVEGLYVARMRPLAVRDMGRDVEAFYGRYPGEDPAAGRVTCRQPVPEAIARDGSTPCLAAVFDASQSAYDDLIASPGMSTKERITAYVAAVDHRLGITVSFHPVNVPRRPLRRHRRLAPGFRIHPLR